MSGKFAVLPSLAIILSVAPAMAQGPAAAAPAANGDVVLASAVDAMGRYVSVSANVREQVNLFGQQLFGTGQYVQQGTGPRRRFRFELTLQGTRQKQSAVRISDGNILYLLDDLGEQQTLRIVNLRRVEEVVEPAGGELPMTQRPAEMSWGGLPRVLAAIQENFQFDVAQQSQMGTVPVWILRGLWQPEKLRKLLAAGSTKPNAADAKRLPSQMPEEVVIYLGREELFPYRIEYRGRPAGEAKAAADTELIAAMDLFKVQINVPLNEAQFARPAELPQLDDTEAFLNRMGYNSPPPEAR